VRVGATWQDEECEFWLEGQVQQARLFGENLLLERRLSTGLASNKISIRDRVTKSGDKTSPLTLLYHVNLGFPCCLSRANLWRSLILSGRGMLLRSRDCLRGQASRNHSGLSGAGLLSRSAD